MINLACELLNVFPHFLHKQGSVAQHLSTTITQKMRGQCQDDIPPKYPHLAQSSKNWDPKSMIHISHLELFPAVDQAVSVDPGEPGRGIAHGAARQ